MVRHQIYITFDAVRDFTGQRDLATEAAEPKLNWHLQRVTNGWVLISEHWPFVEHITQPNVTAKVVEEFLFCVVRKRAFGEDPETMVGLSSEYVSWAVVQKLPAKVAKRLKAAGNLH